MPFNFTIRIIGGPGVPAQFVPQGANPGDPLVVKVGDTVTWGNDTRVPHQPVPVDAGENSQAPHLSDQIEPLQSSSPTWVVPDGTEGMTIHYRCKLHDGETGMITVFAP
jgi:plastocyanin